MFQDASIGNSVNIVLVRILLLEDEQVTVTCYAHHGIYLIGYQYI